MDENDKTPQKVAEEMGVTFDAEGATIPLAKPITISGVSVKALRMREPDLDDQLVVDGMTGATDLQKERAMVANLCMVAPAELGKVKLKDYRKVQTTLLAFLA